ncbi:MAG TPA: vWA domain-containing protein, partial [Gemmatimonadaceae bacterium]|nr:vWA domain-containing protein [Gemmatimonadaceae bacterium]
APGEPCGRALDAILACVRTAARPLLPAATLTDAPAAAPPVVFYIDGSGSMTGYLDQAFAESFSSGAGGVSYRRVLSRLSTLWGPRAEGYSFGTRVVRISARSNQDVIAQLVQTSFYNQTDTRVEDVLDQIAKDSARARVHLIVTDGRRDDGASTMAQYKRVGELARAWAADEPGGAGGGGMFALAVSAAPFRRVSRKFGGCWTSDPSGRTTISCPVYVFAFLPRAAANDVLPVLRGASTRLFVAPAVTDTAIALHVEREGGAQAAALRVQGERAAGQALTLLFGPAPADQGTRPFATELTVEADLGRSAARFSVDDSLAVRLFQARLTTGAPRWAEVRPRDLASAWVKPLAVRVNDDRTEIELRMALRTRAQLEPAAYRVEVLSTGMPAWLGDYESASHGDSTRTFGLSSLFEHLRARPDTTRLFGLYGVVH